MSAFVSGVRGAFLYLSKQKDLRHFLETSPNARRFTSRFIAGLTLDDALRVARELQSGGVLSSLDHLGENVSTTTEASEARDAYLSALTRVDEARLDATVSMKVTSIGLDLSEELCLANTETLARKARETGSTIECDMEDSSYTERNLRIVRQTHNNGGSVRAVIQAYLYRSEADIEDLSRLGIPVRLCKGAYREPASVAFQEKSEVDRNYVKLMKALFDRGTYPAIASHDDAILAHTIEYARAKRVGPERFEFQMLHGVRRKLQREIIERGFRLRVYVPYGAAWYPYFMRRLAERPANVLFAARSLWDG